jgi:hypothetical protein
MAIGSTNRYLDALWKFIGLIVVLHLIILVSVNFMSNKVGLYGLKVFWAHISGGIGTISIALIVAILVYFLIYKYWTHN